jgi:ABC-type transport system involved in cytochrome c biogenesis permease subunit
MPEIPSAGQLTLLVAAIAMFALAEVFSLLRLWGGQERGRIPAKASLYWGITLGLCVLIWHSVRRGNWLPLQDNFDALLWLGLLLALFVAYTQRVHPLRGLDSFIVPIVLLLLVAAAIFGREKPHEYVGDAWSWAHRMTAYGGALAFAVAGAVGAMYLIADRRLRHKQTVNLASLERLEHFTRVSVGLGFPLLTVGMITGLVRALDMHGGSDLGPQWYESPKVWLAVAAWLVYALVLHAPMNPIFRGRRAALLSVVGLILMIGTLVAVQYVPAASR